MKRKNITLFLASCFVSSLVVAQLDQSQSSLISTGNNIHLPKDYLRNNLLGNNDLPNKVVGSQYYKEEFLPGKVFVNDSISYNAMLRYNAYSDEIEMQKNGKISGLFKRPYLTASIVKNDYSIKDYAMYNEQKTGYFITLVKGTTSLYKRQIKLFIPGKTASSTYNKETPPSFRDEIGYYLLTTNNKVLQKIKLRNKSIYELLGEESRLKKYMKANNINLKLEADLIKVIKYYNSLITS